MLANPEWSIRHTETDLRRFVLQTPASVDAIMGRLERAKGEMSRGEMNKGDYAALETNLGFHYNAGSLLANPISRRIAGIETVLFDWMHVFFVNGVGCTCGVCLALGVYVNE